MTSPARSAAVQELADRAAIQDVLVRYARTVDGGDLDAVAALFIPAAAYQGALGTGTIDVALARLRASLRRYRRTMHVIGHQLIEIDDDRAQSETYAVAYHELTEAAPMQFVVGVRYLDELVRNGAIWLITRRVVRLEWQRHEALERAPGGR